MSEIQTARQTTKNGESGYALSNIVPAVDVIEDGDGITLYADLPGVNRERLNLRVEQDALIIEGTVETNVSFGAEVRHQEVDASVYRRVFTLSKELDVEKVNAQLSNGVLKLRIPKAEHAQPKRITVTVN